MTTTEEALELAADLDMRALGSPVAPAHLAAEMIRALVAERDAAQAKLAQVREWTGQKMADRVMWTGIRELDAILAQPENAR